jgi:hypothetical protein
MKTVDLVLLKENEPFYTPTVFVDYFDYEDLLIACGCSIRSGSKRRRVRKNPKEFIRKQNGIILVTERYGKTIAANAIVRKLNEETRKRRLSY